MERAGPTGAGFDGWRCGTGLQIRRGLSALLIEGTRVPGGYDVSELGAVRYNAP